MFTGLIEEIGSISHVSKGRNSYSFSIHAEKVLQDSKVGDSICTNGACLTITKINGKEFTVDVMSETVSKTNFSDLKIGSKVNLERAMLISDRLGGHLVSGHIDGIGHIASIEKDDIAWRFRIKAPDQILFQIIDKGSISIDGISLTIVQVYTDEFEISIIPHTASETTLLIKKIGDTVNLETDMIGKYVQRFLFNQSSEKQKHDTKSDLSLNFLQENGFL